MVAEMRKRKVCDRSQCGEFCAAPLLEPVALKMVHQMPKFDPNATVLAAKVGFCAAFVPRFDRRAICNPSS
jgi:hypothetical protein